MILFYFYYYLPLQHHLRTLCTMHVYPLQALAFWSFSHVQCYVFTPQDLDNCIRLRQAQVEKIEATYKQLQEPSSGASDNSSACCVLNQDLIKLTDKIKLQQGGKLDYEMVINRLNICIHILTLKLLSPMPCFSSIAALVSLFLGFKVLFCGLFSAFEKDCKPVT